MGDKTSSLYQISQLIKPKIDDKRQTGAKYHNTTPRSGQLLSASCMCAAQSREGRACVMCTLQCNSDARRIPFSILFP